MIRGTKALGKELITDKAQNYSHTIAFLTVILCFVSIIMHLLSEPAKWSIIS